VDGIIRQYGGNETQMSWKLLDSVQTAVSAWFAPLLILSATVFSDNQHGGLKEVLLLYLL